MSDRPLSIYIGYDTKEAVAFSVLASSILRRASAPVSIVPLTRQSLGRLYTRPRGPTEATEFSLTRFLVPYLSNYEGYSIFMDCDMLCQVDIYEIWLNLLAYPGHAVWCSQHDYVPKSLSKFNGNEQTKYPRKNWSSFVVFDTAKCKALTPEYVNSATGLELHRFKWLEETPPDIKQEVFRLGKVDPDVLVRPAYPNGPIGSLPLEWNWLVGEYEPNPNAKILHYTLGTPCFADYANCDQADLWWAEYKEMVKPAQSAAMAVSSFLESQRVW